jgi:glutamate/tyrosine decarboxylase-like PLP-dependent enzyme
MARHRKPGTALGNASDGAQRAVGGIELGQAWSAEEIRRVGYRVIDMIAEYLSTLPSKPVFAPFPRELAAEFLQSSPPAAGRDVDSILDEFQEKVAPYPFGQGHPRFWGFVNPPPTVIGIFADALAATMNSSCAGGNHAAYYVERQVIDWFKETLGVPPEAMGLLVSGGSMATLTGLAVARHLKAGVDVRTHGVQGCGGMLTVYMSQEGHSCLRKAVEMLGLGSNAIRAVPVDDAYRMRVADLEAAIRRDIEAGRRPVAVVASAGTVNTGAIDPLRAIHQVCQSLGVWLHVDAAYGGPAVLTERYRSELGAMNLADSLALDPHKWLYVPIEAGMVLVRDGAALRDAFSLVPPYIRTEGSPTGVYGLPWLSEYGFQQTRGFRALKVWMALKHHGLNGYAEAISRDIRLSERLAQKIRQTVDLELMAPPSLSIVCFRFAPRGMRHDNERLDALNKSLLEQVQLGGTAFLSSTILEGKFVLRACIVNPRSDEHDIDLAVKLVRQIGRRLLRETRSSGGPT